MQTRMLRRGRRGLLKSWTSAVTAPAHVGTFEHFASGARFGSSLRTLHSTPGDPEIHSGVRRLQLSVAADGCAKNSVPKFCDTGVVLEPKKVIATCDDGTITTNVTFGEDAAFVVGDTAFGVADGVGGWRKYDIDPADFSSSLMMNSSAVYSAARVHSTVSSLDMLTLGYEAVVSEGEVACGASTACVASFDGSRGTLETANIGDSGWRLLRSGSVVAGSEEQRHSLFTPYQLSVSTDDPTRPVLSDPPSIADTATLRLQSGDVIILATDGLFDNLYDDDLVRSLRKAEKKGAEIMPQKDPRKFSWSRSSNTIAGDRAVAAGPRLIANFLVRDAVRLMNKRDFMSPFASRATEEGFCIIGGKIDDITVVVATVEEVV